MELDRLMTGNPYDDQFFNMVRAELARARAMFPETQDLVLAAAEEVGELTKAVLDHKYKGAPAEHILKEAVQSATMAARVATEGDSSHPYSPHAVFNGPDDGDFFEEEARAFAQGGATPVADVLSEHVDVGGRGEGRAVRLPDGSGVAFDSFPLPSDHWLTAGHSNIPPMPFRVGRETLRLRMAMIERVSAAGRYAVRCATQDGTTEGFDPDALIQNLIVGMLGYNTPEGLSDDPLSNPEEVRPPVTRIEFGYGEDVL
jgi:hypothetical protein